MVVKTKKKKVDRKSVEVKAFTFKELVDSVIKGSPEKFPAYLHTAADTGWFTDEKFLTQLTDQEHDAIKKLYAKHKEAKKASLCNIDKVIPKVVGIGVSSEKQQGRRMHLSSSMGSVKVVVDASLFLTLKKRHPDANIYFSMDDEGENPIIFSGKTTEALLMPLPVP